VRVPAVLSDLYRDDGPEYVISSLFVSGFADYDRQQIHAVAPDSPSDAYAFCVIGHEVYHIAEGLFHDGPDSSCDDYLPEPD